MEPHDLGAYEDGEDHSYQPLSWRTDPATSLSDWDVVVTWEADGGGEETRTYHVHKQTLAVGPRSGAYWAKLFARWADGTAASEMRLDAAAAACVPALLDYVYDPRGALDVSTATAMPLLHLASYLGMRSLYDALVAFVQRDLRPETAAAYVAAADRRADRFGLDRCRAAAVKVCASHMEHAPSLEELAPDLFLLVACSEDRCCTGAAFSRRVASYYRTRASDLEDPGDFLRAIGARWPGDAVDPGEALFLLGHALDHGEADLAERRATTPLARRDAALATSSARRARRGRSTTSCACPELPPVQFGGGLDRPPTAMPPHDAEPEKGYVVTEHSWDLAHWVTKYWPVYIYKERPATTAPPSPSSPRIDDDELQAEREREAEASMARLLEEAMVDAAPLELPPR
ncbi:BTB/POZ domain containing protein [Aureococcus anophagefferens]|nr:BTB/POZ domain containing protein [Aureococcus anophagefferens]